MLNSVGGIGAETESWDAGYDKGIEVALRLVEDAPTIKELKP